jgi:hypothetical protein
MVPRHTTPTALGLATAAALLLVLGVSVGAASAAPGNGAARGHEASETDSGNGPKLDQGPGQTPPSAAHAAGPPVTVPAIEPLVLGTVIVRPGASDLGPAAAAPATATSAAEPGAGVADQVAAGPGADTSPVDVDASRSAPRAVVELVARSPASPVAVIALLFAALVFLLLQPALDRHDERLALAGADGDVTRFR